MSEYFAPGICYDRPMTETRDQEPEAVDPSKFEKTTHKLGAGVIFYIQDTRQFMFFRRTMVHEETGAPLNYPGWVDVIGGRGDPGETDAFEVVMREVGEELVDADGLPYQPNPAKVELLRDWTNDQGSHLHAYGCVLDTMPDVTMLEGDGLVFLTEAELAETDIAFGYTDVAREFATGLSNHD